MNLVIHIGLHKAASTTFQNFLNINRSTLSQYGVLYPQMEPSQSHFLLPRKILEDDWVFVEEYMKSSFKIAKNKNVKTIFISAEGFETFLLEYSLAVKFEIMANKLGFSKINWVCILRKQWDYFNSLYAQLSKDGVCLNYETTLNQVIKFGEISVFNGETKWRFAFDYDTIIDNFMEKIQGSFSVISFDDFVDTEIVGAELINKVIEDNTFEKSFWDENLKRVEDSNSRDRKDTVEIDYLANFIGVAMSKELFSTNQKIFIPLVQHRLSNIESMKDEHLDKFTERFPQISKKFLKI